MSDRVSFSAVVVMYNEERRLPDCLESLKPCNQIIAIDLGSIDASRNIAGKYGATILDHPRARIVERVRHIGYPMADNDWILIVDPDEVIEPETYALAAEAIERNPNLAAIRLPMQNYFMGKPLATTIWSCGLKGPSIINRNRVRAVTNVHDDVHALPECETMVLASSKPLLRHYWVDGMHQLFEKHLRYLAFEGEARHARGERFSPLNFCRAVWESFVLNFIDYRAWRGGWRGWFLTAFHLWYTIGCQLSLFRYGKTNPTGQQALG